MSSATRCHRLVNGVMTMAASYLFQQACLYVPDLDEEFTDLLREIHCYAYPLIYLTATLTETIASYVPVFPIKAGYFTINSIELLIVVPIIEELIFRYGI